jgi:hypothetical protein
MEKHQQQGRGKGLVEAIAWVMDSALRIPGTRFRIGLDGIIGLVPWLGDTVGALISTIILLQAALSGVSVWVLLRMGLNIAIEWVVGLVPLLGDVFDFGWKANTRNMRLYRAWLENPAGVRRRSVFAILGAVGVVVAMMGLLLYVGLALVGRLVGLVAMLVG